MDLGKSRKLHTVVQDRSTEDIGELWYGFKPLELNNGDMSVATEVTEWKPARGLHLLFSLWLSANCEICLS